MNNNTNHTRHGERISECYIDPSGLNVELLSQIAMAAFSLSFYIALFILALLSLNSSIGFKINSSKGTSVFYFIGILIVSINVFTNESNLFVREVFRICSALLVGVLLEIVGAWKFFVLPNTSPRSQRNGKSTLGAHQPSMGTVVGVITLLLVIMEVFLAVSASRNVDTANGFGTDKDRKVNNAGLMMFTFQKAVQALTYLYIRHCLPDMDKKHSASLFLKILSLFNFTMWIDSLGNSRNDLDYSQATIVYGPAFNIPATIYEALLIDFRLLCSMLFLEHAFQIEKPPQDQEEEDTETIDTQFHQTTRARVSCMTAREKLFRCSGLIIGSVCVTLHAVRGLQYVPGLNLSPWLHVLGYTDTAVILPVGIILLRVNTFDDEIEDAAAEETEKGIDIMVSGMGAISFLYWVVKATLAFYWASGFHNFKMRGYFGCQGMQCTLRAVSSAFLIVMFVKIKKAVIITKNEAVELNYILVPIIMIASLSTFIGSAIDQYIGEIDTRIGCEPLGQSLKLLFQAGPPIHLGFCIHLFIHFLTIQLKMGKVLVNVRRCQSDNEREPLLNKVVAVNNEVNARGNLKSGPWNTM